MTGPPDRSALSIRLARRARGEAYALHKLAAAADIADETVGLYAQQAVELWLAAVIVQRDSVPARDHDLGRLIEILRSAGIEPPPAVDRLRKLSQYAAPLHGEYFLDLEPLDRDATVALVEEVGSWADTELKASEDEDDSDADTASE
jgi:HEPN domain-containing protein